MNATSTLVKPQQALIEVLINIDTSGNIVTPAYFNPDVIKFMLGRKLIALESFCSKDFPFSPITPSVAVVPDVLFKQLSLTLLREPGNGKMGGDFYKNIPLTYFRRVINGQQTIGSAAELWRCDPIEISWSDSFVSNGNLFASDARLSVPFLASFLLPEQNPDNYLVNQMQ